MPRKLSSIVPDWWDYTTIDAELVHAAAVPMSLLADHPNVQFNYYRKGLGTCEVEMH